MGDPAADDFIRKLHDGALRTPLICRGFGKSIETGSEAFLFSPAPSRKVGRKFPRKWSRGSSSSERSRPAASPGSRSRSVQGTVGERTGSGGLCFAPRVSAEAGSNLGVSPDQTVVAAAVAACFPPIGTMIAAVLAAVAAVIALLARVEGKSRGEGRGAEGPGPMRGRGNSDLVNALRHLSLGTGAG